MRIADCGLRTVVDHAREAAPDECCGLLLGRGDEIVEAIRTRNISDSPATRFLIDPADHFAGIRAARARGLDVVGFYHSHPCAPAEPSERDLAEFDDPDHFYLIVSLRAEPIDAALFRFTRRNFQRLPLVTVG